MYPAHRKLHFAGALYLPLQNALIQSKDITPEKIAVLQAMVQYTFGRSFGVFASVSSQGRFSVGVNFYNPIFMPFLF